MRVWTVLILVVVLGTVFGEILDPSFDALKISSTSRRSLDWNCAGLVSLEMDSLGVEVVYRTNGFIDMKSFSLSYVQSRENPEGLAGSLRIYRVYRGYNMEILGTSYDVAGSSGNVDWGLGMGLERVKDEVNPDGYYSVYVNVGVIGEYGENLSYAFSLRKLRLWSERLDSYLLGDFGMAVSYRLDSFTASLGVMMYEAEYFRPYLGLNLGLGPVGLGFGGEVVIRRDDLSYAPRVEGAVSFNMDRLSFGLYGGYMFGSFSDTGIAVEMVMDTVLAVYMEFGL